MLVTKTAINVIGEIAKKGYLIINKNCKSDLQNSESLFYLKIFFSKPKGNRHKKLCLAAHKLRKGEDQSPTFFSSKTAQNILYRYSDNYPH